MRLLFIGDIVGKAGRDAVKIRLERVRAEHKIDFCVANGENIAHGFGITAKTACELFSAGVDLLTGGNHSWDKKEVIALMESKPIIRPLNFPSGAAGKGIWIARIGGQNAAIINLMGFHNMGVIDNPFRAILTALETLKNDGIKHIAIDFHCETTAEKNALLKLLEGKVGAIAGTHTHVGTDDLLIARGTGYVSDIGLCGVLSEVIGMDSAEPIRRYTTGMKQSFEPAGKGRSIFQAIVFELNDDGLCADCYKIKAFDDGESFISLRHGGGW
ncbi:MAG: YmdB family metallophosphoesterase [Helicobacteraceae bacterium]|nr:YmdB family metallophosphoesterase [Helicobacteraceae bacterium]